jgi:hypothetical protein
LESISTVIPYLSEGTDTIILLSQCSINLLPKSTWMFLLALCPKASESLSFRTNMGHPHKEASHYLSISICRVKLFVKTSERKCFTRKMMIPRNIYNLQSFQKVSCVNSDL